MLPFGAIFLLPYRRRSHPRKRRNPPRHRRGEGAGPRCAGRADRSPLPFRAWAWPAPRASPLELAIALLGRRTLAEIDRSVLGSGSGSHFAPCAVADVAIPRKMERGDGTRTRDAISLLVSGQLQILRSQTGLFGQHFHSSGAQGDPVMVGKQHVRPTRSREDAVRCAALALDGPTAAEQRGQRLLRLRRGPVLGWILRRQ